MLTDAKIKAAKPAEKPYRLGDSGQLYLHVSPAGGRLWRMNYTFGRNENGRPVQKTLSFGAYPAVTLSEARSKRDEAKRLLAQGKDPAAERRNVETEREIARRNTFRAVFEAWFELNSGWSLEKLREWAADHDGKWSHTQADVWTIDPNGRWSTVHSGDVLTSIERDVLPAIGNTPIASLKASDVLGVLQKVERRGAIETGHRLRQRISAVFVYGVSVGICDSDPAASLGKALKPVPKSKHQPSIIDGLPNQESRISAIRQLLIDCEAERCRAQTKFALRLLALTAVRPGELAGARWEEFDLEGKYPLWTIPAERMKGIKAHKGDPDHDHLVPLARQSVELLWILRRLTGRYALCFPCERHVHRPISENTLRALLIRAGYYQRHVPHGFRAAFSTYMNERRREERQEGDRAVIDLMLAHTPNGRDRDGDRGAALVSASESAYNRAAYMPRRRELAQEWADVLLAGFADPESFVGGPIRWAATGPGRPKQAG